jgi:peroxiredoxin Q/BCP
VADDSCEMIHFGIQTLGRSAVLATTILLTGCTLPGCATRNAVQRPDGGAGILQQGALAPKLETSDHTGKTVRIVDAATPYTLVYFYPADFTPGCTAQACAFRDVWDRYQQAGVRVVGVSMQSAASHVKFANEKKLPFSLIADEKGEWAKAFGVSATLGMTSRQSFLIDATGMIRKTYAKVDAGLHAEEVLKDRANLP